MGEDSKHGLLLGNRERPWVPTFLRELLEPPSKFLLSCDPLCYCVLLS